MQQVIANTQLSDCERWRLSWRPPSVGPCIWIPQHDWECAAWECGIPEEVVNIPPNLLNQHSAAGSACHGMQRWMRVFVFFFKLKNCCMYLLVCVARLEDDAARVCASTKQSLSV